MLFYPSPVTLVSSGVVPAADAGSVPLVALVSVSVTLAGSAAGEAPVTRLTSVALLTESSGAALTVTGELVTQPSHRTFQTATAGWTEGEKRRRKGVGRGEEKKSNRE